MYLRNAWYVACTPDEIAAKPLGRTICGDRMVLFRAEGGAVAALEDFCPHRGAPLSLGSVRDDGQELSGDRALRLRLGLAGREVARRPGQAAPPAVGREPGMGLRRRAVPR